MKSINFAISLATLDDRYVNITGDTMTGDLIIQATSDDNPFLYLDEYSTNNDRYGRIYFRKSDSNTAGALAETDTNDYLGNIKYLGVNNAGAFAGGAYMSVQQTGASGAYVPASMEWATYSSTGANDNLFVMNSDRSITIAGTLGITPTADSTTAFQVNQADTSEVFRVNSLTRNVHITGDVAPSSGAGFANKVDAYCYDGAGTQWFGTFNRVYTVTGESSIGQVGAIATALYHEEAFEVSEWRGFEGGGAFISGTDAACGVSKAYGGYFGIPTVTNAAYVTTAAAIYVGAAATTGIVNAYAILSEQTSESLFKGKIVVNNSGPGVQLIRDGGQQSFEVTSYANSATAGSSVLFKFARGTEDTPLAANANDIAGQFRSYSYIDDGFMETAKLRFVPTTNFGAGNYSTSISFMLCKDGDTDLTNVGTFGQDASFTVGTSRAVGAGNLYASGLYMVSTQVIDSSRNLVNINTIQQTSAGTNYFVGDVTIGTTNTPKATLFVQTSAETNVHTENYADFIVEDTECTMQMVADDAGSNAGCFVMTNAPAAGDNKHWIMLHAGATRSNRFSIGYGTSAADNFSAYSTSNEAFTISTAGYVGINETAPGAQLEVVASGAAVVGQIVKAAASQTANIQEWQDSSGDSLTRITNIGEISLNNDLFIRFKKADGTDKGFLTLNASDQLEIHHGASATLFMGGSNNELTRMNAYGSWGIRNNNPQARVHINTIGAAVKGLIVQAAASQSANLTEWQNSGGTALSYITATGSALFGDKVMFTQTDGNEYIDSLADGYVDYGATTAHRFNNTLDITTTTDPQLRLTHTDGVDETDFYTNSDGELEIMPTARTIYLGDGTAGDATFGFYGNTTVYTLIHDDSEGDLKLSANDDTNYVAIAGDGSISQAGTARIDWNKWTANGAAVTGFTTASAVADLQTAYDGNLYTATEVAGGGNYLIVDFASVTAFNWVKVLGYYDGNSAHNIKVEVEITPFDGSAWHTFDSIEHQTATTNTMQSHDFFIPSDTAYINSGVVKIRFLHSASTSAGHTLVLDEVSLYQ